MPIYNLNDIVTNESHTVTAVNADTYHTLIPIHGPFFKDGFELVYISTSNVVTPLVAGVDYNFALMWISASRVLGDILYGAVTIQTPQNAGTYRINRYKTAGSPWSLPINEVYELLVNNGYNPRLASWEQVIGQPAMYPPTPHTQPLTDFRGYDELIAALDALGAHIMSNPGLSAHITDETAHPATRATQTDVNLAVHNILSNEPVDPVVADKAITLKYLKDFILRAGLLTAANLNDIRLQDLIDHNLSNIAHPDIRLLIDNNKAAAEFDLAAHLAAPDPHPQYTKEAEVNAIVDSKIAIHDDNIDAHPKLRAMINKAVAARLARAHYLASFN